MAPEQIDGELLDPRTDLYALGCVAYELLTGRAPFVGDISDVVNQHHRSAPAPLSKLVTGVPEELEQIVMRMLEKTPRDRLAYAADCCARRATWRAGAALGRRIAAHPELPVPPAARGTRRGAARHRGDRAPHRTAQGRNGVRVGGKRGGQDAAGARSRLARHRARRHRHDGRLPPGAARRRFRSEPPGRAAPPDHGLPPVDCRPLYRGRPSGIRTGDRRKGAGAGGLRARIRRRARTGDAPAGCTVAARRRTEPHRFAA